MRRTKLLAVVAVLSMLAVLGVELSAESWSSATVAKPPASDQAIAYTLTAAELGHEYARDRKAYRDKFSGKRVEISGTVVTPRPHLNTADIIIDGDPSAEVLFGGHVVVAPRRADVRRYDTMRALSRGQKVTARGIIAPFGAMLEDAELISVGPNLAGLATIPELLDGLGGTVEENKFTLNDVVVRAEIRNTRMIPFASWAEIKVSQPGDVSGPAITVHTTSDDDSLAVDWYNAPVGKVVVLIGIPGHFRDIAGENCRGLRNARLLEKVPEGIAAD